MNSPNDDHADKYNDPRAKLTGRGIAIGIAVVLLGIAGSALSIFARRTHLERTTEFWGPEVIEAFQLAEEVELLPEPETLRAPEAGASVPEPEIVRLTGLPGLGHLRHVLLDDRSYDWESVRETPISSLLAESECVVIRLRDPTASRFPDTDVVIDLQTGWLGNREGDKQVRFRERFRQAVPNYLKQIADYEPIRVELRKKKQSGG